MIASKSSFSAQESRTHHCFPENDIKIPVVKKQGARFLKSFNKSFNEAEVTSGLSELEYHQVIDKFERTWKPIIKEKFEKDLLVTRDWENDRVNAHATRDDNNNPVIVVRGGLARHGEITKDGLTLILCHELGHHYGGAPKSFRGRSNKRSWSSAEGQADYFASSKCMPKIFEADYGLKSDDFIQDKMSVSQIDKVCATDVCRRISMAALSVGKVFASLKYDWFPPKPLEKSESKVEMTVYRHPDPQCRFDTFLAGAKCDVDSILDFDDKDYSIGACLRDNSPEAARPQCWFSSQKY